MSVFCCCCCCHKSSMVISLFQIQWSFIAIWMMMIIRMIHYYYYYYLTIWLSNLQIQYAFSLCEIIIKDWMCVFDQCPQHSAEKKDHFFEYRSRLSLHTTIFYCSYDSSLDCRPSLLDEKKLNLAFSLDEWIDFWFVCLVSLAMKKKMNSNHHHHYATFFLLPNPFFLIVINGNYVENECRNSPKTITKNSILKRKKWMDHYLDCFTLLSRFPFIHTLTDHHHPIFLI